MPEQERIAKYKEARRHGTAAFPCAFYQTRSDLMKGRPFEAKHHWQEELKIIHIEKGHFRVEINMKRYDVSRECLCFVNSGELHYLYSQDHYLEQACVFSPSVISFRSPDASEEQLIEPFLRHKLAMPVMLTDESPAFSVILKEFKNIGEIFEKESGRDLFDYTTGDAVSELKIKASLLQMIAALKQYELLTPLRSESNVKIDALKKTLTYIQEHYREKIYISRLAELMSFNEQYFCRFFKKAIGKSPVAYINEYRIRQAIRLLRETSLPITDIAYECGFTNLGHFINEFKKETGETPLKLRKKYLYESI